MRTPFLVLNLALVGLVAGCNSVPKDRAPSSEDERGELFENPLNRGRQAHAARPWAESDRAEGIDWSDDSHFCAYFRSGSVEKLVIAQPFFAQPGSSVFIRDGKIHPEKPSEGSYCELRTRALDARNRTVEKKLKKALVNGHYPFEVNQEIFLDGCLRDRDWQGSTLNEIDTWVNVYAADLTVDLLVCHPDRAEGKSGQLTIGEFRSILKGLANF